MLTNAIKKGDRFQLRNGWNATMKDNKKGNIRFAEVEGVCTELGSVYAHDIVRGPEGVAIEYTPAQDNLRALVNGRGF